MFAMRPNEATTMNSVSRYQCVTFILLASFASGLLFAGRAKATEDSLLSTNTLVMHVQLDMLTRSSVPNSVETDGRIIVLNSCGYDTAIFDVREVIEGTYSGPKVAARVPIGEHCEDMMQKSIADYLIVMHWKDGVWTVDQDFSSPLVKTGRQLWAVEPRFLTRLLTLGAPPVTVIDMDKGVLNRFARDRLNQSGIEMEVNENKIPAELQAGCSSAISCWNIAPLFFTKGISLDQLRVFFKSYAARK